MASVTVASTDIYVYVKVDNVGTIDLGACPCGAALPAPWALPTFFSGFSTNPNAALSQSKFGVTFSTSTFGDSLAGPGISVNFGIAASGRRAWDWSPDGRFFAWAGSVSGNDWSLTIVALQNVTRSNGTVVNKGQLAVTGANGIFSGVWLAQAFGWAGSQGVVVSGQSAVVGLIALTIACPLAPAPNVYGTTMVDQPTQVNWAYLVSPCGSVIAVVPKILSPGFPGNSISVVSTATATTVQFTRNNVPTTVQTFGANPTITTTMHGANGVQINTGTGTVTADDPDCTMVGGGVVAWVDRVKASTLPSANLGVMSVGSGVVGLLKTGKSLWVQVPNSNPAGWANQGDSHWCLLAQAYTSDGVTIAKPWNGQAASPPAFPVANVNCAQRNIGIS